MPPRSDPFWRTPLDRLYAELSAGAAGLSAAEAAERLAVHGPNLLKPRHERALLLQFLSRFANPLLLLLLAAAAISGLTGDVLSCGIITLMIAVSVTLDFVQDAKAGHAAEKLRRTVALRATVVRDGRSLAISAEEIVPGDVVLLEPGSLVPADGRVLEAGDLFVNQSALTGEAYPVEKSATEGPDLGGDPAAATNAVFMGTSVISGTARVLVCRTGSRTAVGEIGESLLTRPPATAFEIGTRRFGLLILRLAILLVLFVLLVNALFHRPWLESFLFAVALAVGLTPELLPMVVSVTLSRGAIRMAKERVIVKRLTAVHDLGSMDVLCTDKTGTLTEARIRLEQHVDHRGLDSPRVLELAYLNSSMETGIKSSMDDAILRHSEVDVSRWKKIDEVPFDFERRRVSVLADDGGARILVLKGAYEDVLALCTRYEQDGPGSIAPLDEAARAGLRSRFEALSGEGFRVLG
ncbi:MAG TPA: HAD-IC family P-type ATPase, partial [Candidatus Eisenbacteria bacterium]